MIIPLFQGIFIGLTITVSFGPGFIALFQTSVMRGVKAGFVLATGILMSDLVLIGTSYFGLTKLLSKDNYMVMGIIAGTILIITGGFTTFFKPSVNLNETKQLSDWHDTLPILLIKGFILNIANPFSLIFWIGVMGFAASNFGMHTPGFFCFFAGLVCTAFFSDLLKCYLSGLLRKILASNAITIINKVVGIILMVAGIFVIWKCI
jgi:threonine/homoserine/homoserine lactone efflux protein